MNMDGSDIESIQRRMEDVRHELDDDIHEITDRVREFGVWRSYVKAYPWVCLSTAALLGYLIVRRKQKSKTTRIALPAVESQMDGHLASSPFPPHQNVVQVAIQFLGPVILRAVSTYIGKRVGEILDNHHENTRDKTS